MGYSLLGFRTPEGTLCPGPFRSNEKLAYRMLSGGDHDGKVFSNLMSYLQLDGAPLLRLANADEDEIPQHYNLLQDERWQSPSELASFLSLVLQRLDTSTPGSKVLDVDEEDLVRYLDNFRLLFSDLLSMASWADEEGVSKIRLEWSG